MTSDLLALLITLRLAITATLILLLLGIPLAWWLAGTRSPLKTVVESIVALPLVLPPTVLGFYLLIALSPQGVIGGAWRALGGDGLAFTFSGLVIGSVIYSLPFVVQPLQNAFVAIGAPLTEAAATLRAAPLDRFFTIVLPMARSGLVTAATLGFAHTVGEFGVVLMIGGNIPGETQVLSIAIYDHVESLEYANAHLLSMGLLCFSFMLLFAIYRVNSKHGMFRRGT
uniref:Molybdenum transport system permease n=1 Tax=Candidatus Kentrum sp. TC TaxID=2126339 RepID=A0A451A407_9GAMM|nr:MAG: molybdate transport system permease protein [Candidatus Kentron sp. TC]VFK47951.1 MAG: molybdate transport system permease protein [Candidatus Kentron sp. TC]VFK60756.1 MAG: molybdate transport system permease protein [Candidatus Kentron sp. TC]